MGIGIMGISYALPSSTVSNQDLVALHPSWNVGELAVRTGVELRHVARTGETALDLGLRACEALFADCPQLRGAVRGILFCTESPDYILPPNACVLHGKLGLDNSVLAFDFNLACSGFVYGLAIVKGLVQTGMGSDMILVCGDTYSKFMHPDDRAVVSLFGDGVAASWIGQTTGKGIVDVVCSTAGSEYERFIVPAGGCRMPRDAQTAVPALDESGNARSAENIYMDGMGILTFVTSKVPRQVRMLLDRNGLKVTDIDLFVFHQASALVLDSLTRLLHLSTEQVYRNLSQVGNTVSASIPIALKDASDQGLIHTRSRVLVSGFGVGLSWATAILEY
ncbi:MAG: 3-oxoacyl-ACP synthase [Coprothermobacter sp.]|nr:3-oxoacyl-ACP synthase [Coprothermobacter sp.]